VAEQVIEIRDLHKAFGSHEVLKGIDFTASKGEVVCIIGSTRLPKIIGEGLGLLCAGKEAGGKKQVLYTLLTFLFCLAILVLSTISLVGSSYSAFLYYRF